METPPSETSADGDHVMVRVRLFARARDIVGQEFLQFTVETGTSIGMLREKLVEHCPGLATIAPHLLFALDNDYVPDDQQLKATAEVACFPPVSGG